MKAIFSKRTRDRNGNSKFNATDHDGNRVQLDYDPSLNDKRNHELAVRALCAKLNWSGSLVQGSLMKGGRFDGYVWVWRQEGLQTAYEIGLPAQGSKFAAGKRVRVKAAGGGVIGRIRLVKPDGYLIELPAGAGTFKESELQLLCSHQGCVCAELVAKGPGDAVWCAKHAAGA